MTKKTDKTESITKQEHISQDQLDSKEQKDQTAEAIVSESGQYASEPETYTLTAEEFAAAKAHIESLQKEKEETVHLMQRVQADFDNFRRRNASVRLDSYEEGKRDAVKELLPALDNLERALNSIPSEDLIWREGIVLVERQMKDALKKLGLEEIESDCKFDPVLHEAVMREKADGIESGEIVVVLQKGYRMGDKIIRHCMVKVAE